MYDVWMRCYPQVDENISEEWELSPFTSLNRVNAFIADLEKEYSKEEWRGHRLYNAKFYAKERRYK